MRKRVLIVLCSYGLRFATFFSAPGCGSDLAHAMYKYEVVCMLFAYFRRFVKQQRGNPNSSWICWVHLWNVHVCYKYIYGHMHHMMHFDWNANNHYFTHTHTQSFKIFCLSKIAQWIRRIFACHNVYSDVNNVACHQRRKFPEYIWCECTAYYTVYTHI